jgi:hypothetical protein|tara:strand:- start:2648 stop:3343 length:696 start_codon:yes stop_codon:yes gene_type:complete
MGYLNNTSIIVDAILTKKGRELLARQDGSFQITQFALGDDEIDYTLFNENHPNGSQFSGEAIENMNIIEAFPDDNNIMISKLVTLPRGTTKMPVVTANVSKIQLSLGSTTNVNPETLNLNGVATLRESGGYLATIADRRLLTTFSGVGTTGNTASTQRPYSNSSLAETIRGTSFTLTAISATSLFGNNARLLTSITIEGIDSGARVTIPLEISKEVIATTSTGAETGVTLT